MKKYVYKCVRQQGELKFCSCSPPSQNLNLNYRLNRWTKAFNGTVGIFVFTTLQQAHDWSSGGAILKCEYVGEPLWLTRRMDFISQGMRLGLKSLVSIFSTPEKRRKMISKVNSSDGYGTGFSSYDTSAPFQTHVVNAVKPVKIVRSRKSTHYHSRIQFREGANLPDWMDNKWRIKR